MSYPIRITDQLKPHLRALRKTRGLTQAQLGTLIGVKQARIAEIESNPGAVSLDQLTKVLAALGATLHLHEAETRSRVEDTRSAAAPAKPSKARSGEDRSRITRLAATGQSTSSATELRTPAPGPLVARKSVPKTIPPKKGSW